jgi:DNA topoisomerase VI subunit B
MAAPRARGVAEHDHRLDGAARPVRRLPHVKRSILSFSRDLEFATETELAKRVGCRRHYRLRVVVKEMIDNSLDSAEEHGIDPEITITIDGSGLTVADNGPGMSAELVERLCIRSERTSIREAFAACDPGSQGNALPVIMALAFGFGREEAGLTITSRGVEHAITLRVNRLKGCIDLERATRDAATTPGTSISLVWPMPLDRNDVCRMVYRHALLNQHAAFAIRGDWGD